MPVGQTARRSFTVHNGGGSRLRVNKSQPPGLAVGFTAAVQLPEGTTIDPGQNLTLEVDFQPKADGPQQDRWILTADDDQGPQEVTLKGAGGSGDGSSGAGGCSSPGPALAWWASVLLVPWLLRRRRAAG